MLFDQSKDHIHLKSLMEMIRDHLVLNNLDCMGISKTYKAFEWLQGLEAKMDMVVGLENEIQDLREALDKESEGLRTYIQELELEIEELKKPKAKKKKKTKKVSKDK